MIDTAINFFAEHRYQLALPVLYCAYVALREFSRPIIALFCSPSLTSVPTHASANDGWVREPLQSAVGREWERSTGCSLESRKPSR